MKIRQVKTQNKKTLVIVDKSLVLKK